MNRKWEFWGYFLGSILLTKNGGQENDLGGLPKKIYFTSSGGHTPLKAFFLAHPVGVAVVGGALVGAGAYYLMNKLLKKKEEPATA